MASWVCNVQEYFLVTCLQLSTIVDLLRSVHGLLMGAGGKLVVHVGTSDTGKSRRINLGS